MYSQPVSVWVRADCAHFFKGKSSISYDGVGKIHGNEGYLCFVVILCSAVL